MQQHSLILYIDKPNEPELEKYWLRDWLWRPNAELVQLRQEGKTVVKPHTRGGPIPFELFLRPHTQLNVSNDCSAIYGRAKVEDSSNPDDGPGLIIKFLRKETGGKFVWVQAYQIYTYP